MSAQTHHYLSQAFLTGFTDDDGNIWMLDRKTSRISLTAPRVIASEKDLYAFTGADGTTRRDIETNLFRLVDGPIRPILRKLAARQDMSEKELADLSLFVGFLRVRTPAGIDEIEQASRGLANRVNPFRSKEYVEEWIKNYERDTGQAVGMAADEIVEVFTSGRYQIVPERGHLLVLMCKMGQKLAMQLRALDWTFLVAPQARQFIVSDYPFVIVPPSGHDGALTGVGILSQGAVKYVALSAKLCLKMGDVGTRVSYQSASSAEVRRINCWTARNSERFVFGGCEALLQRVIKIAKLPPGEQKSEVVIREIPHATDPTRSLLHVFARPKIAPERSSQ
ncbi:MAG TPA: DUF4238 domain-containing protein [Bryobacterales bacterium]|nr:DUF4238 domain-containing protein [Bryobacterales bacterium]